MKVSRVSFHTDQLTAEMARNILLDFGLSPMPIETASNIMVAGAEQGYWVFVPESELEKAKSCLMGTPYEKAVWN